MLNVFVLRLFPFIIHTLSSGFIGTAHLGGSFYVIWLLFRNILSIIIRVNILFIKIDYADKRGDPFLFP